MQKEKLFKRILKHPVNVSFADFVLIVEAFGFQLSRISGSHHIFKHASIPELINIQDVDGQVKPYQVRQFLSLVERYSLKMQREVQ